MAHFHLLVDPANKLVLDAATLRPLNAHASGRPAAALMASLSAIPESVRELLSAFPTVFAVPAGRFPPPLHGVEHTVETTGRPVFAKARRLEPARCQEAKAEFSRLEAAGIVRRSKSAWSSPLHMVPKKTGGWRPCGDYRQLNNATVPDRYPLPNLLDLAYHLNGSTVFSKIDLAKGYHQVPMAAGDVGKTAIVTPFGLYEFIRMPFGLKNSAQTFQRLMDKLFAGITFVFVYLDDVLVFSPTWERHIADLKHVFHILRDNGLIAQMDKCVFGRATIEFLGHTVSSSGLAPLPVHVSAVLDFPAPSTVKDLQRFLGMLNFYRRFVPKAAAILQPLTDALVGNPKTLTWGPLLAASFAAAKTALVDAAPLAHPAPGAALSLASDASDSHVGGVLQQWVNSAWIPLSFFSQKLTPTQRRYSTFDRELLAAYLSVRHFRFALEGRAFQLHTDHRPLLAAATRVSPPWSARQQRHLAFIAEFTSDLRYVPGAANVVADALSRPPLETPTPAPSVNPGLVAISLSGAVSRVPSLRSTNVCPSTPSVPAVSVPAVTDVPAVSAIMAALVAVNFTEMATAQLACPSVADMMHSPSLQVGTTAVGAATLYGDVSTGGFRPLVPVALRRTVYDSLHAPAHPGARASRRLVSARFVWPGLAADVTRWAAECLNCQRAKVTKHVHLPPEKIALPDRRFSHLHVDLVGPLPPSGGFTHLFTIIDRATRW
ncbi:MAG: reverse transcriptase domain-containing protein, partial [Oscillospiraceae bacterium]